MIDKIVEPLLTVVIIAAIPTCILMIYPQRKWLLFAHLGLVLLELVAFTYMIVSIFNEPYLPFIVNPKYQTAEVIAKIFICLCYFLLLCPIFLRLFYRMDNRGWLKWATIACQVAFVVLCLTSIYLIYNLPVNSWDIGGDPAWAFLRGRKNVL